MTAWGWLPRLCMFQHTAARRRLAPAKDSKLKPNSFNTQPPEGGWKPDDKPDPDGKVSTHSRPKAAGRSHWHYFAEAFVSTHSRPKATGLEAAQIVAEWLHVSTHSRPKAAGQEIGGQIAPNQFQHTAARRRLAGQWAFAQFDYAVSTHSRPKAAGTVWQRASAN